MRIELYILCYETDNLILSTCLFKNKLFSWYKSCIKTFKLHLGIFPFMSISAAPFLSPHPLVCFSLYCFLAICNLSICNFLSLPVSFLSFLDISYLKSLWRPASWSDVFSVPLFSHLSLCVLNKSPALLRSLAAVGVHDKSKERQRATLRWTCVWHGPAGPSLRKFKISMQSWSGRLK